MGLMGVYMCKTYSPTQASQKKKGQSYLLSFQGLKGHLSVLSSCIMNGMLLILTVTYCATRLGAAIMFTTFSLKGCSLVESSC